MNKRFLSAILFGALMVTSTGTFVSCKDYDDDISNLQSQIDSEKSDLTTQIAAVNSSISSLQSAQTAIEKEIAAAKDAATKAALEAQKAATAAAHAELVAAKEELNTSLIKLQNSSATKDELAAISDEVKKTNLSLTEALGRIQALEIFQGTTEAALQSLASEDAALKAAIATVNEKLVAAETSLQGAIDKLTEKVDANTQAIGALNDKVIANGVEIGKNKAAIEAQIAALNAYKETNDAAVLANKGQIETILGTLETMQEAIEALNAFDAEATAQAIADNKTKIGEISTLVSTINDKVELISAAVFQGVTHVSLIASSQYDNRSNLNLVSAEAVRTWIFGDKLDGAISFEKGTRTTFENTFVLRVSPVDAVLTADNIKLINSKGEATLAEDVVIKDVKPYTGLLLSRGISTNGLWEVTVAMNPKYDAERFVKATSVGTKQILFAASVSTTMDADKNYIRNVVSEYELKFANLDKITRGDLDFTVDGIEVDDLHNRYNRNEESRAETGILDYVWKTYTPNAVPIFSGSEMNVISGDNRYGITKMVQAVGGTPIVVQLGSEELTTATAFYIVLDKANALSSDDSELAAWNAMEPKITGINKVYNVSETAGKAEITFPANTNDVFGFRVYAINDDGSLLDPDGRAFYVRVGKEGADWNSAATVIVPSSLTAPTAYESPKVAVTCSKLSAPSTFTWVTDKIGDEKSFDIKLLDNNGVVLFNSASTENNGLSSIDFTKVASVVSVPATGSSLTDWQKYTDGKAYNGILSIFDSNGRSIATLNISMTKNLPTTLPSGFSVKTAQVSSGIYNCYMIPGNDTTTPAWGVDAANKGTMKMTEVFNFGKGEKANYNITFDASEKDGSKNVAVKVTGDASLTVAKDFIDNITEHNTSVVYNYGAISSVKDADGNYNDVTVSATNFKTVYNCIYNKTYSWNWATAAQMGNSAKPVPAKTLTYGTNYKMAFNGSEINVEKAIYGTSAWDGSYSRLLSDPYEGSLQIKSATLTSDANGEEEYFKVTVTNNSIEEFVATATSSTTNPTAAVASTLNIKATDMYGHEVVIKLPMTVNKR